MSDLLDDILPVELKPHPAVDFTMPPFDQTRSAMYVGFSLDAGDASIAQALAGDMKVDIPGLFLELLRRAAPSPNGRVHGTHVMVCAGCGDEFDSNRRQLPGKRSWCGKPECKKEAAALRSKDYRDRKTASP